MNTRQIREKLRWKHRLFPELIRLAWPIGVSMLSYSVMTLVDTLFVGRLGAASLAGVGVGGVFCFTLLCYAFGLLRSVKVLVSQAIGSGERSQIAGYLGAGLILAMAFGLGNILVGRLLSAELGRITATVASAAEAKSYVDVRLIGAPFFLIACATREAMYGRGDSRTPMLSSILVNIINIALDDLLILRLGYGVGGAAWASVVAQAADALILLAIQQRHGFGLQGFFERTPLALRQIREVWSMGVPLGAQMLFEVGAFMVLTAMFASMSEIDIAAHQIALQVDHFAFLPALAIGEAASIMIGQAVGANEDALVRRVARRTLLLASAYTGLCALLFALGGRLIASAFSDDVALVDTTTSLLWVAAVFVVFDGANIVARCVLRGTGDVRYPAVVNVGLAWLIAPPLTLLLGYGMGWGVVGGWAAFCVEIILASAILWWRLERGHWKRSAEASRERMQREVTGELAAVPAE